MGSCFFPNVETKELNEKTTEKSPLFNESKITCLLTLKDGRLASSNRSGELNIYNETLSQIDLSIKHESSINSFIQLHNENLVICSGPIMKIVQLKNKKEYTIIQTIRIEGIFGRQNYFKVIETKKNELITIYSLILHHDQYKQLTVWRLNKKQNYEIHCQIQGGHLRNILKLNKNEFVVYENIPIMTTNSHVHFEQLVFRDLKKYNKVATIGEFSHESINGNNFLFLENMCLLSNDLLFFTESLKNVYVIKISTHEKISKYLTYEGQLSLITKLDNNVIFIIGRIEVKKEQRYGKYHLKDGVYKDYISLYRYNNEEFEEILDEDNLFRDNDEKYALGIKYKKDLIACSYYDKIKLIKIKI